MNIVRPIMKIEDLQSVLREGKPIENVSITEQFDLEKLLPENDIRQSTPFDINVVFKNCYVKGLWVPTRTCTKRFSFESCNFKRANLFGSYLLQGINISNCTIKEDMFLFAGGGHNRPDMPIIIKDTTFYGLVDFGDAWFQGPVIISNCNFVAGTNLLGNTGKALSVKFDIPPELTDNRGNLDMAGDLFDWKGTRIERPNRKRFLWF